MKLLDIIINIIGILVTAEFIYNIIVTTLWNFKYGHSLVIKNKKTSQFIRTVIFVTVITHVSSILQIILVSALFISAFILYKYIKVKNKTVNKNNAELQSFYISEIKKETRNVCIAALFFYLAVIVCNYIV